MFNFFSRILLLCLLALGMRPVRASHVQGGSLSYQYLRAGANGTQVYRVRADVYRDCMAVFPATYSLRYAPACGGTSQTVPLPHVRMQTTASPYGSVLQAQTACSATSANPPSVYPGFATHVFEGEVTLSPGQWILSVADAARPVNANLVGSYDTYLEATLDNRQSVNNSAVFDTTPIMHLPVGQPSLLHFGTFDADGDSLAYSLTRPLSGCGVPIAYATNPISGGIVGVGANCFITIPTYAQYSALHPLPVAFDTVGSCPFLQGVPRFEFDAASGALLLTPSFYTNSSFQSGRNKYNVVVQVTEWRKINGVYTVVGTVRRDILLIIIQGVVGVPLPRFTPTMTVQSGVAPATTQARTAAVYVHAGEPITVTLGATTTLSGQSLTYTLEQNTVPGAAVQTANGQGRLTFTPPLSLPSGTYHVSLTATDDASPLRNLVTVPVKFQVYRGRMPLATRSARAVLAIPFPTPFTDQVQFQLAQPGVQELSISDALGRVVARLRSQADGTVRWQPAADLPAGLYLARTPDGQQVARLLRSQSN